MEINYNKTNVSIGLLTRVCHTGALLLNLPGMSIYKNSFEQWMRARIALFSHFDGSFEDG